MRSHWKVYTTAAAAAAEEVALLMAGGSSQASTLAANGALATNVAAVSTGQVRTYYIAAEEGLWDYAPDGSNNISGAPFTAAEEVFTKQGSNRIGHKYRKSLVPRIHRRVFHHARPRPEHAQGSAGALVHLHDRD